MPKHQSPPRVNKRNSIAADLRTPKYRLRIVPSKRAYKRRVRRHPRSPNLTPWTLTRSGGLFSSADRDNARGQHPHTTP
jgi:hypothetical protein